MSLGAETIERLDRFQKIGDAGRSHYYRTLRDAGDPYGAMALGVVDQDQMAGMVAYSYAEEVAKRYCRPISEESWILISVDLMRQDFLARQNPDNFEAGKPSLKWNVIRGYHGAVFGQTGRLPPIAWTAWIPLLIDGEPKDEKLWHRMLSEGFLKIAVQTAWLATGRLADKVGVSRDLANAVVPLLSIAPPVATGQRPRNPAFDRCMTRLAPLQLRAGEATEGERLAVFYLDCLASAVNVVGRPGAVFAGIFGPSAGPTLGDLGRNELQSKL